MIEIRIELTEEESTALNDHAIAEGHASAASYLHSFASGEIRRITERAFEVSAERLVNAAKSRPFSARKDLIALVTSKLES